MNEKFYREDFTFRLSFINKVIEKGKEEAMRVLQVEDKKAEEWLKWYEKEERIPLVLCESEGGMIEIRCESGKGEEVEKLPLIVKGEKTVEFDGNTYHLKEEGLYRFLLIPHKIQNLILLRSSSPLPLLRCLSLLQIHGNRHSKESRDRLKEKLREEAWISITCGTISSLGEKILKEEGFRARRVSANTLEKWNTYNNGHCLLEVFLPEQGWTLVDLDMGFLFRGKSKFLSAYEFWKMVQEGIKPKFYSLSENPIDPYFLSPIGFNFSPYYKWKFNKIEWKWDWYRRIFQTIGIREREKSIFFGPEKKLKEYFGETISVIPEKEWVKKFY